MSEACAEVAASVRENVRLRRAFLLEGPPGLLSAIPSTHECVPGERFAGRSDRILANLPSIGSIAEGYLHMSMSAGLGTLASVVLLQPAPEGGLGQPVSV